MKKDSATASVSVVMPCFRCGSTVDRAITSILNQTQMPAEIILVDDASGDDTLAHLQKLALEYPGRIKVIALTANQGAGSARNAGWAVASQPYIAFMDSDDAWHPKKIEIQYNYMKAHPEVILSGHAHRKLNEDDCDVNWEVQAVAVKPVTKKMLLLTNCFVTPSAMLKRDISFRFAEGRRHMEDHLLWLEIACNGGIVTRINVELAAIFKPSYGAAGLSAQLWSMELGDLQNYQQLHGKGCINFVQWMGLSIYSLIKFSRRLVVYWGFIRWKK